MEKLSIEQMEVVNGGGCGSAGGAMAIAGGVLGVALMLSPVGAIGVSLGWGLAAAFGTSFSVAGIGCGIADML